MSLIDFILNVVGLLLWFNWRAARFDPLARATPSTLAGTLRRAEKTLFKRWHIPLILICLLILRALFYWEFGAALNWTGKLDVSVISIPFHSNDASPIKMLLFSFYSFGISFIAFLSWMLFLSALKSGSPENDSLRQLLQLHLGRIERWPCGVKLVLPLVVITLLWWLASWPLTYWKVLPQPASEFVRIEQSFLVAVASYLVWKILIGVVLALHFVSNYVYFGQQPFWQHLDLIARQLLTPLRRLPLKIGKVDFTPLVGIGLVFILTHFAESGIKTPPRKNADGSPGTRLVNIPGLVDIYQRISK